MNAQRQQRTAPEFAQQTGQASITDMLTGGPTPPAPNISRPVAGGLDFNNFNVLGGAVGAPNTIAPVNNLLQQTQRQNVDLPGS
jgi:hypothetical protein